MKPFEAKAHRLLDELGGRRHSPLTPREHEVAELVGQGFTNREIAERLVLSERTPQNHVAVTDFAVDNLLLGPAMPHAHGPSNTAP